jgi:hypothetical protein
MRQLRGNKLPARSSASYIPFHLHFACSLLMALRSGRNCDEWTIGICFLGERGQVKIRATAFLKEI